MNRKYTATQLIVGLDFQIDLAEQLMEKAIC